jgi:enoyl-CoA hydratase
MDDASSEFVTREDKAVYETDEPVLYSVDNGIATVTMNRPTFNNVQNSQMTYALDAALRKATDDDSVKVIVLRGEGRHFSAGHDIGTPGRDINKSFDRAHLWWDHTNKPGGEQLFAREQEVYLGMCRRWRDIPKPMIAMVQGACVAGGLMLAWVCDLIVASDAFFRIPWCAWASPVWSISPTLTNCIRALPRSFCCWASACRQSAPIRWAWSTAWCRVPS